MVLQNLAEVMDPFGHVVALEGNSSNLINVIEEAFNVVSRVDVVCLCVYVALSHSMETVPYATVCVGR